MIQKQWPPVKYKVQNTKVLDEITGFARSRHPVKVHCYQWTTSNFIKRESIEHLAIQQFTKAHSGCSPSLLHNHLCIWLNHRLKLLSGLFVRSLKDITVDNPRMTNGTTLNLILVATQTPEVDRSHSIGLVVTLGIESINHSKSSERLAVSHDLTGVSRSRSLSPLSLLSHIPQRLSSKN